jgi:hypothetical protein
MAQGSLAIQSEKRNRGIMFGYCERLPRRILYSLEDALRRHTGCIAFFAALAVFETSSKRFALASGYREVGGSGADEKSTHRRACPSCFQMASSQEAAILFGIVKMPLAPREG